MKTQQLGRSSGRRSRRGTLLPLSVATLAGLAASASAQPQGGQVASGSATFAQNGANTVITAANGTIINYQSFNIPVGTTVRFVQPGSTSKVLNRVLGADPSVIGGSLFSNGIVYIVNPAGVVFSQGAVLNVGGIYAGAGRMSDADFLAGRNRFTSLTGKVENYGTITTGAGGAVGLIGAEVSNYGAIAAPQGMVVMAAGNDVLIGEQQGSLFAKITGGAPAAGGTGVRNAGSITAGGGRVLLGAGDMYAVAIDHSGTTTARDIRVEGGEGGVVSVAGTLDASSATGAGGSVKVLGDKVGLFGATVGASGATGGGSVLIGGNARGVGPERNATATYVSRDSTVRADAVQSGRGGSIVVWSELVTRVYGKLSATGGAAWGDGGFIETSGHKELSIAGTPKLTAFHGRAGTWLIDPEDLDIVNTPTTGTIGVNGSVFTSTGAGAELFVGDLVNALTGGANVQVVTGSTGSATGGVLTLRAGVDLDFNGTGTNSLTLSAHRKIVIDGRILDSTPGGDALNLTMIADSDTNGTGNVEINNTVSTGGGQFVANGVDFKLASGGSLGTSGGTVLIAMTGTIFLGAGVDAGAGNISFNAPVVLTADTTVAGHDVTFLSTVNSDGTARDLTINTTGSGDTRFAAAVGGTSPLDVLTTNADGSTIVVASSMDASTMAFGDTVSINADTTLHATTSATFDGAVISPIGLAHSLTVNSPLTVFNSTVGSGGGGGVLDALHTNPNGTTTLNGATIAADVIDFQDDVILARNVGITATTSLSFARTVNSQTGENNDLTITSPVVVFNGAVGGTRALGSLQTDPASSTTFNGGSLSAGLLLVQGALVLGSDTTITATSTARFVGAVTSESGEGNDLIINSPDTRFTGLVGGGSGSLALGLLRTDAAGTTQLKIGLPGSGFSINAATIDFQDNVQLIENASLHGTSSISFGGTVTSGVPSRSLALSAPTTTFGGSVSGLSSVTTSAGSTVVINAATFSAATVSLLGDTRIGVSTTITGTTSVTLGKVDSETGEANNLTINSPVTTLSGVVGQATGGALGSLSTDAAGTTTLSTTKITAGTIVFHDAVEIGADLTIAGTGSVSFTSTLDNDSGAAHTLTVNSPLTLFSGVVGGTHALGTIETDAAGTTTIDAPTFTAGIIRFNDGLVLDQSTTINAATLVKFGGTVDSTANIGASLTINSASTTFVGDVGSATNGALGTVTTDAPGTTILGTSLKAAAVDFKDELHLAGTVTTTSDQLYNNSVLLANDATLVAPNITFFGAVNSEASSGHSLSVNTVSNGVTTFVGPVGTTTSLSTLTTNADGKTILSGGPVRTSGAQTYNDAVVIGITTTLTGTNVTFGKTLDSDGLARSLTINTIGTGNTTFSGAVGSISKLDRLVTNSDGKTIISGGSVQTVGAQIFSDAVVIDADTVVTGGAITFGGTLNSNTTPRSLTVNSSNNGVTTFVGAVGATTALTDLTTNADGRTRILASSITTLSSQTYNDALAIGANATLSGSSFIFASTINADTATGNSGLTVNSSAHGITNFAGVIGGTIPLKSLTTNADGTTKIGANVTVNGTMAFNDAVVTTANLTLTDTGSGGIVFGGTLDSDGTPHALSLNPNAANQATTGAPAISRILFGGAVGGTSAFSTLTLGADRSDPAAVATIAAGVNASGSPTSNYSLTITTTGDLIMGLGQKFSVVGNLTLNVGGTATLGDISTLGNLAVTAPSIVVRTRAGGLQIINRGGVLALAHDAGVDFVAGGTLSFSQTPTLTGGFLAPAFATPGASGISSSLSSFSQRSLDSVSASSMVSGSAVLDLGAVGASSANLAQALPGPVPPVAEVDRLPQPPAVNPAQTAVLAEAGVDQKLATERRVPTPAVRRFSDAYDALFYKEHTDASGQVVREPQADHIRDVLAAAWKEYAAAAKDKADAVGFRAYVDAVPTQGEAKYYMATLRELFARVGEMGLQPAEAAGVRRGILDKVVFPGLSAEQLETAIMTTQLGAATREEPALAAAR